MAYKNPFFDLQAAKGALLFHRFSVIKEPAIDFLNPEDFWMRNIFRPIANYKASICISIQNKFHKTLHKIIGFIVICSK